MSFISNKINQRSLRRGDHIYAYRTVHLYSHHGIYVGENKVIQFTRTLESSDDDSKIKICNECGYEPTKHRGLVKTCLSCFLKGHSLYRFKYGESPANFVLNRAGTCTTASCHYSEDQVVQRATDMLDSDEGFGDYDPFENNCESFAMFCKTGKRVSLQAFSLKNKRRIVKEIMRRQSFSTKNAIKSFLFLVKQNRLDTLNYDRRNHGGG